MTKIFLIALILSINIFPQGLFVSGIITDSTSSLPLQDANILVTLLPDSITYRTASVSDGSFKIEKLPSGSYGFSVRYIGYKTFNSLFQIKKNNIDLGIIKLSHINIETDTVFVIEKLPLVILKGDTVEYNSEAYKTRPDEYAKDLIKKLPGVSVEGNKVTAEGEEVKEVLVNGKNFLLDKPEEVLKKIPAKAIDKVQVYDKKSEKAKFSGIEDGEKEKGMNLMTKKKNSEGLFGKTNLGIGSSKRYYMDGDLNMMTEKRRVGISAALNNTDASGFSGLGSESGSADASFFIRDGIGNMSYLKAGYSEESSKDFKLSASYSHSSSGNELNKLTDRTYRVGILEDQVYSEKNYSKSNYGGNNITVEIEYKLDSLTAIYFHPELSLINSVANQSLSGFQIFKTNILNSIDTRSNTDGDELRINNNLMIKRTLNEKGRTLLADFSFHNNNNKSNENFYSEILFYDDLASSDTLDQHTNNKKLNAGFSSSLAYQEPIDEKQKLNFNLIFDYDKDNVKNITTNDRQTGSIDTSLSNIYDNYLSQYILQTDYSLKNDNLTIFSSLKYDISNLQNNQTLPYNTCVNETYHSLNALFDLNYIISKDKSLMFEFRNRYVIPEASLLQTVVDNSNPLYLKTGNPGLNKMSIYNFGLSYRSVNLSDNSFFSSQGYIAFTTNQFGYNRIAALQDTVVLRDIFLRKGQQLSYPVNLDRGKRIGATASYGFPLDPFKSRIEFEINGSYNSSPTIVNNLETNMDVYGLTLQWKLSGDIGNVLSYFYNGYIRYNSRNFGISAGQNNYWSHYHTVNIKSLLFDRINLYSSFLIFHDNSLPEELGKTTSMITAGIGIKLFKDMSGELRLEGYNLTDENSNNYSREIDSYIENTSSNTIGRYFLLRFIYQLKNFWGGD